MQEENMIVMGKLNRLGRSTKYLIKWVATFNLISLNDTIDTSSPSGILVFQIFCALAEHERNVIVPPNQKCIKKCGKIFLIQLISLTPYLKMIILEKKCDCHTLFDALLIL